MRYASPALSMLGAIMWLGLAVAVAFGVELPRLLIVMGCLCAALGGLMAFCHDMIEAAEKDA